MPNTQTLIEKLRNISNDILKPEDFHEKLAPAVTAYTELLFKLGKIDHEGVEDRKHIGLEFGNAVGTFWAANCVKEVFRTQRFIRGLHLAIKDKLKQKGGTVNVLYAGTGPFATLALPIMTQFRPEEVQFSFLEINKNSFDKLQDVILAFDLQKYIKRSEIADATGYVLPDKDVDIVLSETLNRALITEPQVFIMLNIAKQLDDDVIFIPEEITVNLCIKKRNENKPNKLKTLINFNLAQMRQIIRNSNSQEWVFEEIEAQIEDTAATDLCYATEIKVYRNNFLGYNDSSLNLLERVKVDQNESKKIYFKYSAVEKPGFKAYVKNYANASVR